MAKSLRAPDGSEAYTRAGALQITPNGQLLTGNGLPVIGNGGPIAIPDSSKIEIGDDGTISIACVSAEGGAAAKKRIEDITAEVEVGKIYEGPVTKILEFGALVNLLPGKDGLLHISQIAHERVEKVTDYLTEGQVIKVKVLETDEKGRVKLYLKALLDRPAPSAEA